MSSDRETLKADFLARHGYGDVRRQPLGGDASTRSYERLYRGEASFIFMDQPPALETAPCPPGATPDERRALGFTPLPASLDRALQHMEESELVAETLGEQVFEYFLRNKREDWQRYRAQVTRVELEPNLLSL